MTTKISKNLDFLRWKFGTHEALAERLKGIVNWNQLSKYATAGTVTETGTIRAIESRLKLPVGWCERDNFAFTELSVEDHELVSAVLKCTPATKAALQELLRAMRAEI